jgi:CheY-like chemotaxis protein
MMPDMDGIETQKILRERGLTGNTKVIALTANAVVGAREMYLETGFDDYLSKPIQIPELEKMLGKYLSVSIATGAPAAGASAVADETPLEKFKRVGLDVGEGITYCAGDEGLYEEIVHDYAESVPEKIEKLNGFLADNDLKDYKILIHSVKSSSKTIGAMELFEKARALEMAAADEDRTYIDANHEGVMTKLRDLSENLL